MPEREPRITDASAIPRYLSDSIVRKVFPRVFLSRRAGTVAMDDSAVHPSVLSGEQQWVVDRPALLDRIMNASWRQMRTRQHIQQEYTGTPAVLAVDAALPGGIRQISIISSSGSEAFDTKAAAFIRSLPFAHEAFVSEPGEMRSPALYRAIIAVTTEAKPAK